MKNKVAFILHPLSVSKFYDDSYLYAPYNFLIDFFMKFFSDYKLRAIYSQLPAHKLMNVKNFRSDSGSEVDILTIMCPLFPAEALSNSQKSFNKILAAVKKAIAAQANVIVLAGFSSIATKQGEMIRTYFKNNKSISITTGNTFTAALALKGIEKAMQFCGKDFERSTVAIIGASGDIGSICSRILSKKASRIILFGRRMSQDDASVRLIKDGGAAEVIIARNIKEAVELSEVVLVATSSFVPLIEQSDVNPFSIIADVSLPHNVPSRILSERKDVFVFDAGKARLHNNDLLRKNKKWNRFTSSNKSIHGCLAEGLLLALEGKNEDFSIGQGNIEENKVEEILVLANRHGFDVSDFAFHEKIYSDEQLAFYRDTFTKKRL